MRKTVSLGSTLILVGAMFSPGLATAVEESPTSCAAPAAPSFEMAYIDRARAGGEPIVTRHPDGQLLWGSHAGTTHFYSPAAASPNTAGFVQNYEGQTYYYVTDDQESWEFVPRTPVKAIGPVVGVPATGFSDPEFAIEQDGTVYVSEINLANVAVSKSEDGGHSYELVNVFSFTSSDRQWMAADGDGELYMTANGFGGGSFPSSAAGNLGHFMAKSTDGGLTWGEASKTNSNGVGDIQIDHERGIMYEMTPAGSNLQIARFPNIREESTDFTVERFTIATGVTMSGVQRLIDPTFDMDAEGNLYATWSDNPANDKAGIFYASSTDQGETWSTPIKLDTSAHDDVWPWIAVGEKGNVAVAWLESNKATNATLGGEAGGEGTEWHVKVATSTSALGCDASDTAAFTVTTASSEPVHVGTICQHGTTCQADRTDRRLGDYFTVEVDAEGAVHVAVSDTRQGGAISLPLHIRQTDGPLLVNGEVSPDAPGTVTGGGAQGGSSQASTTSGTHGGSSVWRVA